MKYRLTLLSIVLVCILVSIYSIHGSLFFERESTFLGFFVSTSLFFIVPQLFVFMGYRIFDKKNNERFAKYAISAILAFIVLFFVVAGNIL